MISFGKWWVDASLRAEDGVGSGSDVGHASALSWHIAGVFAARPWLHLQELLHFEQSFGRLVLSHCRLRCVRVDVGVGHRAGTRVRLGWSEHLLAEAFIAIAERLRLHLVLIACNLAVEVPQHCLDRRRRSQRLPISVALVLIRGDHFRGRQFFQVRPRRTSIPCC